MVGRTKGSDILNSHLAQVVIERRYQLKAVLQIPEQFLVDAVPVYPMIADKVEASR
jgi:hypothetical protein